MASLIHKKKNGRLYTYWVRAARVNGKPRIVEQVYLGPKERVLQEIKAGYTRGISPGPCPLKRVGSKEFGASALLWHWAQQLRLADIVDRHVPPPPSRRRTGLSVGQYLLIAAINRAVQARSKRALYTDWYQHSVLSRLCRANQSELSSQRFWDHMEQVEPQHIEAIQQDLLSRLSELFPLGEQTLLYDTTNYFSFIDTFNHKAQLAQRGHNKQKRNDLRQLSLALFEDQATGLPLYHQCYQGNRPDVSHFPSAWAAMLEAWMGALGRRPEQLTLVFDAGNVSKGNLLGLESGAVHYVGSIPGRWVPDLLEIQLSQYQKLAVSGTKHLKAYRCKRQLWGVDRTVLMVFSPTLYRKQRATMNQQQRKAEQRLQQLGEAIRRWRDSGKGRGHTQESVHKKIRRFTAREHLRDFLETQLETEGSRVVGLSYRWDSAKKRQVQRRYLGKRVLVSDQHQWDDLTLVTAYRKLYQTEHLFRISKARRGPWWPMFHWTDSKIRVHALYCYFALLMLAIVQMKLREADVKIGIDRALDHLQRIQETLLIYTNGAADRVLTEMDPLQRQLADALGLVELARQMGNTVLDQD